MLPIRLPQQRRPVGTLKASGMLCLLLFLAGCQGYIAGVDEEHVSKYSLKKRKTYIGRLFADGRQQQPVSVPVPVSVSTRDGLMELIRHFPSVPYRAGGVTPEGFDCSGLVQYLYRQHFAIILPRTSAEMAEIGEPVQVPESGDLVFFTINGERIDHVGIAVDENRFFHAASSGVRTDDLRSPYYRQRYLFTTRIITVE